MISPRLGAGKRPSKGVHEPSAKKADEEVGPRDLSIPLVAFQMGGAPHTLPIGFGQRWLTPGVEVKKSPEQGHSGKGTDRRGCEEGGRI